MDIPRSYVPLPPVVQPQVFQPVAVPPIDLSAPVAPAEAQKGDRIIVVHTKDIEAEELALFQFHGKCVRWDDRWMNIPLMSLPEWDYLFVDVREKNARSMLGLADTSKYNIIAYIPFYHKGEKFIDQLEAVALTKFPLRAISKEDFNRQLLNEKLQSPSIARTFLGWLLGCVSK